MTSSPAIPTLARNLWLATPMMRGDDVRLVQRQLQVAGQAVTVDGLFGRNTASAVERYQVSRKLTADRVVGIETWTYLFFVGGGGAPPGVVAPSRARRVAFAGLGMPHRTYADSAAWSVGEAGVVLQGDAGALVPSAAEAAQVGRVAASCAAPLASVLSTVDVPVELVLACICAESGGDPTAERMEPGCNRTNPERTPDRVSVGLMQTLLSTAREALGQPDLPLRELRKPAVSVQAGASYIWKQAQRTGFDPPLVAAAYNAGSVRRNDGPANRWKLMQFPVGTGNHVDRFCRAFNAAMALRDEALPPGIPRYRALLRGGGTATAAPAAHTLALAAQPVSPDMPDTDALTDGQFRAGLVRAGLLETQQNSSPATLASAIQAAFNKAAVGSRLAAGWQGWGEGRVRLAVEQMLIKDAGVDPGEIDGLLGPDTLFGRESFQALQRTGKPLTLPDRDLTPSTPVPPSGPATQWPRQAEVERFYGPMGPANQVMLALPYRMRLAWDTATPITRFQCHEKVYDAFLRVFQHVLAEYGEARIAQLRLDLFGGCFNVRKMRGGTQWSMHSWGIAVDLDPARNALQMTRGQAAFARPEYEAFWRIVEGEGLVSLGRVRDFDWMHFQAARL